MNPNHKGTLNEPRIDIHEIMMGMLDINNYPCTIADHNIVISTGALTITLHSIKWLHEHCQRGALGALPGYLV